MRIDKEYSYGDPEEAWKAFAGIVAEHGTSGPTKDLLVVEVGVQEYGDKINQDLADRYGVAKVKGSLTRTLTLTNIHLQFHGTLSCDSVFQDPPLFVALIFTTYRPTILNSSCLAPIRV